MADQRIALSESWDKDHAVSATREFAASAGFGKAEQMLIATVASELSTNILRYAGHGELQLKLIREPARVGVEVLALDQGCGIRDIDKAMQDHYSTTPGSLGLGLPSVKRIMDDFEIVSGPQQGTRVLARKWRRLGHG